MHVYKLSNYMYVHVHGTCISCVMLCIYMYRYVRTYLRMYIQCTYIQCIQVHVYTCIYIINTHTTCHLHLLNITMWQYCSIQKLFGCVQSQNLVPAEEWTRFMSTLREALPSTFRIAGSQNVATAVRECLQLRFFSQLKGALQGDEGEELTLPTPLSWQVQYPFNVICNVYYMYIPYSHTHTCTCMYVHL